MTCEWEIVKFGWLKESHIGDERFDMQPPAVWDTGLFLVSQVSWSNLSNITVIWSSFFVSALSKYFKSEMLTEIKSNLTGSYNNVFLQL